MLILSIEDAFVSINETVQNSLGPLYNMSNLQTPQILDFMIDFGIQLISTVILFVVVAIFFWKPLTKILEARRDAIDKELDEAKEAKENAIKIEEELTNELSNAKIRIKEMLDQAEKDANIKRDEIINQARVEAKNRLANLEIELEQEKKSMEKEIKEEIISIAFAAAEKIVAKEINHDKYISVVDEILKGANN